MAVQVAFDVEVALAVGVVLGLVVAHLVPARKACAAKSAGAEERENASARAP